MALCGYISTIWAVVVKNSKLSYHNDEVAVDAEMLDGAPKITAARAVITVDSDESEEKLQRVRRRPCRSVRSTVYMRRQTSKLRPS